MLSQDIENILQLQKNRSIREEQLKLKILNSIKEKINNYANLGKTACICKIPNFLIGEIPFNIESVNKFIVKKLKNEGFYIVNISIQYIYISWFIKDIDKVIKDKNNKNKDKYGDSNHLSAFVNTDKKTYKYSKII
tara:strand:+ start:1276 stop:1683 length:408 start_codon:yes stop_codon:yes gene_type:complete